MFASAWTSLRRTVALSALALTALATGASASTINVVNGNFEQTTATGSTEFGSRYAGDVVTGWTSTGYNWLVLPGTVDSSGVATEFGGGRKLWGPGDGSNNGLTASPAGGNYIAMDGAYAQGPLSQTLNGLTVGAATTVSFWFAGAQQYGYDGATTEQFEVSLGGQNLYTPVLNDTNHGFTGWTYQSLTFTPTSTSQVLSFLAIGTPGGEPPFSLLDGVSVSDTTSPVPEPASLSLMLTGVAGIGGLLRRRLNRNS